MNVSLKEELRKGVIGSRGRCVAVRITRPWVTIVCPRVIEFSARREQKDVGQELQDECGR